MTLLASFSDSLGCADFARFAAAHAAEWRNRRVLMYCTGGVRCERASACLRAQGVPNVAQLSGGIHAYLEAFPDGGLFVGKNFVYDPRRAVPAQVPRRDRECDVVGRCLVCAAPWDDYAAESRCRHCRVLVLVCAACLRMAAAAASDPVQHVATSYACEHCAVSVT